MILAAPKRTVFCIVWALSPTWISAKYFFSLAVKLPNTPMAIGVITTFFKCQRVLISIAKLRYLPTFSFSFRAILQSPGHATSIIWHIVLVFSTTTMRGLLSGIFLSVWIVKSHRIYIFVFSTTRSGECSYHLSSQSTP